VRCEDHEHLFVDYFFSNISAKSFHAFQSCSKQKVGRFWTQFIYTGYRNVVDHRYLRVGISCTNLRDLTNTSSPLITANTVSVAKQSIIKQHYIL